MQERIYLQRLDRSFEDRAPAHGGHEPFPRFAGRPAWPQWLAKRHPAATDGTCRKTASSSVPAWKRRLDICCIAASLPFILPLMGLIAGWIRVCSRGPALLRQERIGRNGKCFVLYKFRTMKMNADTDQHASYVRRLVKFDRPMIKLDLLCHAELIAGGCLLRTSGLDELPQLLNVLRGEMSLVGPRPCLPGEYSFFTPSQRERFDALPGLTGIWQVQGKNQASFREMNAMDIHYVRHASASMDLYIMLRTPAALLRQMLLALRHKRTAARSFTFQGAGGGTEPVYQSQRHIR